MNSACCWGRTPGGFCRSRIGCGPRKNGGPARAGLHDDERGEALRLAADTVGDPRPHAGPAELGRAGVQKHLGRAVIEHVGLHPLEDADVIGDVAMERQQLADVRPGLARLEEAPPRAEQLGVGPNEREAPPARERFGHGLPVQPLQRRLRIEQLQMARAARHEEKDDRFRLGGEVARPRPQRIGIPPLSPCGRWSGREGLSAPLVQERRERHRAEAHGAIAQEGAAGVVPHCLILVCHCRFHSI
jgi:hypothetical protein